MNKIKISLLVLFAMLSTLLGVSSAQAVHNGGIEIGTSSSTASGSGTVDYKRWWAGGGKWVYFSLSPGERTGYFPNSPGVHVYVPVNKDVAISYKECTACRQVK